MSIIKINDAKRLGLPKETISPDTLSGFKSTLSSYISSINTDIVNIP